MIKEIMKARNTAVHPSHTLQPAMKRPDISEGLDWRFCEYTYQRSEVCYSNTMSLFLHLHHIKSKNDAVNQEVSNIISVLIELGLVSQNQPDPSSLA